MSVNLGNLNAIRAAGMGSLPGNGLDSLNPALSKVKPALDNTAIGDGVGEAEPAGFSDLLTQMLAKTTQASRTSDQLDLRFQMGDKKVSLEDTVIASTQAGLQFQMVVTVRNKLVQAYTDIMNMPV